MGNSTYNCKIVLEFSLSIVLRAECKCVAGKGGKCNHKAAVLFALVEFNSFREQETPSSSSCMNQPQQCHLPPRKRKSQSDPKNG